MQLNTIKAAVQGFVHMLLERHVPVTLNPAKSGSYNGDLINLPPPANGDPETIMAYMGLAAHEAGHAEHSDITVWRTEVPKLTKLGHALAGFIEDARMECRQIQRYPGVAHLLNLHHASVINRMDETVRNMPESFAVPAAVYLAAQSHLNPTRSYPQQFVDSAWRVSEAVLGGSFRPAVEQMVTKLSANSTEHDGINLAKEIEAFIQSLLANPAPQPGCADEDQAQANSEPQGQGDQSQSDTDRSDEDQAQAISPNPTPIGLTRIRRKPTPSRKGRAISRSRKVAISPNPTPIGLTRIRRKPTPSRKVAISPNPAPIGLTRIRRKPTPIRKGRAISRSRKVAISPNPAPIGLTRVRPKPTPIRKGRAISRSRKVGCSLSPSAASLGRIKWSHPQHSRPPRVPCRATYLLRTWASCCAWVCSKQA